MATVKLNGVDIEKIEALVKDMKENPETMKQMANSAWRTRS